MLFLMRERISKAILNIDSEGYQELLFLVFAGISIFAAIRTYQKKYSLIPVVGGLSCLYLMIEIPAISWTWFFVWMGIGLSIYFLYGRRHSRLANAEG